MMLDVLLSKYSAMVKDCISFEVVCDSLPIYLFSNPEGLEQKARK